MNTRIFTTSFVALLLLAMSVFAAPLPQDIKSKGTECVSLVFNDQYSEAHKIADYLIHQYPKSPVGYFMKAAVYHYEMEYLGNTQYADQFYATCDKGVKLGEAVQNDPNAEWDVFFMAGTLGIRGAYERSQNRLVTSLKLGWRAIDIFRPLKNKGNIDALYGVGVYDFWVGANLKLLWWMKGAKDERPRALKDLQRVTSEGIFTKEVVLYDLLEMYTHEGNYQKLRTTALAILKKHPTNIKAYEYIFQAEMNLKDYDAAKKWLFARETALRSGIKSSARAAKLKTDWKEYSKASGTTP